MLSPFVGVAARYARHRNTALETIEAESQSASEVQSQKS